MKALFLFLFMLFICPSARADGVAVPINIRVGIIGYEDAKKICRDSFPAWCPDKWKPESPKIAENSEENTKINLVNNQYVIDYNEKDFLNIE